MPEKDKFKFPEKPELIKSTHPGKQRLDLSDNNSKLLDEQRRHLNSNDRIGDTMNDLQTSKSVLIHAATNAGDIVGEKFGTISESVASIREVSTNIDRDFEKNEISITEHKDNISKAYDRSYFSWKNIALATFCFCGGIFIGKGIIKYVDNTSFFSMGNSSETLTTITHSGTTISSNSAIGDISNITSVTETSTSFNFTDGLKTVKIETFKINHD